MSEANIETTGSPHLPTVGSANQTKHGSPVQRSFLETFLDSFFQEKNIKWMLVVGAAIVFGSSLMLVTKAWPNWNNSLKFLTILSYTGIVFVAAEVCRLRLGLTSTYKVLHSLTLLLLPLSFLALQWLSAGSAAQSWNIVQLCVLLIPATSFLWFASSRILDHILRGRQSTFVMSYCVLSVAGALPVLHSAPAAFVFMAICWLVFSAGVLKVNRHTFWLTEEHRLPRVFGFLPIAMLGLQFMVLVGTKAIREIPMQWTGFSCVMMAATILMTARTVADVFRQRTGNLVRPLPWHIVLPIFCGLVLTALGMTLSFKGFTYADETTYAVIPTSIVAALLMWMAARDTRHSGFVWAGMICTAVAYQCCPTLFSDVVQTMKDTTAYAINRERVPFSLYGITYLPLLAIFAGASRWFSNRDERDFSAPLKQFVTFASAILFFVAATDQVSLFFVSSAYVVALLTFGGCFRDRRYAVPSLLSLVTATAVAIPALNAMHNTNIEIIWVPTLLAGLAAVLTATRLPDRILNTIPMSKNRLLRHRDPETKELTEQSLLLNSDGSNRCLAQLLGCVLAGLIAIHWMGHAVFHFTQPLTQAALLQYVFLMTAFVLYTLKNPRYLSGMCFWAMSGFAVMRWAAGLNVPVTEIISGASILAAATAAVCYFWLKGTSQISTAVSLGDLRRQLGFDTQNVLNLNTGNETKTGGWRRWTQAFVVPLFDLSLAILSCLAAAFHFPLLLIAHLPDISTATVWSSPVGLSTHITILWLTVAAIVFRRRTVGVAASAVLPLWATATAISNGMPLTFEWCLVMRASLEATIFQCCSKKAAATGGSTTLAAIAKVSEVWLQLLLFASCLSFSIVPRLVAGICLGCFFLVDRKHLNKSLAGFLAIMANIQFLWLAVALGGSRGLIVTVLTNGSQAAIPFVFLTAAISVAMFDRNTERFDQVLSQTWTALLRTAMVILAMLSLSAAEWSGSSVAMMSVGFAIAIVTEIMQAVRRQQETHVWMACAVVFTGAVFLFDQKLIGLGSGISQFILLLISILSLTLAHASIHCKDLMIIRRPIQAIGQGIPILVATMAVIHQLSGSLESETARNAMAMMIAAGIYFQQAIVTRRRSFALTAAAIMNVGLMLLWRSMNFRQLEFYLVPVGLSVLAFVEMMKKELPKSAHDPLRYIGALTILVSPLYEVMDGSWAHMLTLMVLSVVGILAAIGLRIRVLVYAGSAFLLADLVAMVVYSTIANPVLLWIGGIALGVGVIALAAFCENHREKLLMRIRLMTSELATWN